MNVGTRRDARPAAAAFQLAEYYPRVQADPDGKLSLAQDVSQALPPYGFDAAMRTVTVAAVVARFSGFLITNTRPDGFWLQAGNASGASHWAMYADAWPGFVLSVAQPFWACSFDEGWVIDAASMGMTIEGGDWALVVGLSPGFMGNLNANTDICQHLGGPLWIPPRAALMVAGSVANTVLACTFRFRFGGRAP